MGKLVKAFLAATTFLAILATLLIVGVLYGVHEAIQPPQEFRVLETKIIDDGGYPSLLVKFRASKYPLDFYLYDELGRMVSLRSATEGVTAVTLSLVGLNPYTNIVGERSYTLKVFYLNNAIYEQNIRVHGVKPVIDLLDVGVKKKEILNETYYVIEHLKIRVRNEGDTPLYIDNLNTHVLVDGESTAPVVGGGRVTILPGEERVVWIDIMDVYVEKPRVIVRLIIDGDSRSIEKVFSIDLEEHAS